MMKKFLVMKINPQQWKKILAGATFVQIFPSNQLLKEQDIKACSIADKNKELVKNGSFAVPFRLPSEFCITAIPEPTSNRQTSSCKKFAGTVAEGPL